MEEESMSIKDLASLAETGDKEALQKAASTIKTIDLAGDQCEHLRLFRDVTFSRLESLTVDTRAENNDPRLLEPYLQPNLKRFEVYGGELSDELLKKIYESCPLLEEVLIDNPRDSITAGGFTEFVQNVKNLKKLTALYGMEKLITDETVAHLLKHRGLTSLSLATPFTLSGIHMVKQATAGPSKVTEEVMIFPDLEKLVCNASTECAIAIADHLNKLTSLQLNVEADGDGQFDSSLLRELSARLPNLRELTVQLPESLTILAPLDLVAMARELKHLNEFRLPGSGSGRDLRVTLSPAMQDSDMVDLAKELADKMEVIEVGFAMRSAELTWTALKAFGQHCGKNLVTLELGGTYNFSNLESEPDDDGAVLFPCLEELSLGNIISTSADKNAASIVAQYIVRNAPSLGYVSVDDPGNFGQEVEDTVKKLLKERVDKRMKK